MNHSILPLLIENHAHRFSCYNGWKISPESLDELIGISRLHKKGARGNAPGCPTIDDLKPG
jgi:hypothetical protein